MTAITTALYGGKERKLILKTYSWKPRFSSGMGVYGRPRTSNLVAFSTRLHKKTSRRLAMVDAMITLSDSPFEQVYDQRQMRRRLVDLGLINI
jgi:hypothetical protein